MRATEEGEWREGEWGEGVEREREASGINHPINKLGEIT